MSSSPSLAQSWHLLHRLLAQPTKPPYLLSEALGRATYHYSVYKAFGQAPDAALAQSMLQHAGGQMAGWLLPGCAWPTRQLDQACAAAWLSAGFAADGLAQAPVPALLAALDPVMEQEALRLRAQAAGGRNFARVVRYFGLRSPLAQAYLAPLLALPFASLVSSEALPLGLSDGLAAELRVLLWLQQAGLSTPGTLEQLRRGIRYLLALRREVDFGDQKYAVFPYQVQGPFLEPCFSAALGWPHGDLGQALLLYEAHSLLRDAELARIAELVGLNTLLRTTREATGVASSQLYQGAAGVAHLYRKLYLASGQPAYQTGQEYWLTQTQQWLHQELATGFYESCEWELPRGLLGVGLVLLSAVAGEAPEWDAMLL
ncbi:MAG TPA: lanthionine synthetase LanC family protein [Hymenobacter sp.]|jgi:hypothetical protein|uniref:lanthionine synthetase LanC family protein n=1 Tax=Hymenobacter sp. TaxID=1898978 RepID=UPI002ED94AE3